MVAKEIENNPAHRLILVGFIDDNPRKYKRKIMGYPVMGSKEDLDSIIRKKNIQEVIVSFRKNAAEKKREIKVFCLEKGLEVGVRQMKMSIE